MIELHHNNTVTAITPDDSSYLYRSIMAKSELVLKFFMSEYVEFPVGTWCEWHGTRYMLPASQDIVKHGERNYEYTLVMSGDEETLSNCKIRNSVDGRIKFSMCARPHEFIAEIVANLNAREGADVWSVGDCIDATEKTVDFNHVYISEALQSVADAFETEWEIVGRTIHLHKVEYFKDDPLPLSYGKGNGFLPGMGRTTLSDEKPIKRLYVQGGEKNIDRSTYGSSELLLPKGQTLEYEGRTYRASDDGTYIERIDKDVDAVKDDSLDCSEIHPNCEHTIQHVDVVDAAKHLYDIGFNDFDIDYSDLVIGGESPVIEFQSGMLAGREFELETSGTDTDVKIVTSKGIRYNSGFFTEMCWWLQIVSEEQDGEMMPGGVYVPKAGDKFRIYGISLPQQYIADNENKIGAEWDMFREGARYLYEHEDQKFTFKGELQGLWARQNWVAIGNKIVVGGYVLFTDNHFANDGVLIRIVGIKEYLNSPYSPTLEISTTVSAKTVSSALREIGNKDIEISEVKKEAIAFSKRRYRDSLETIQMLQGAIEGFGDSISPVTIQTMMMLVGDKSLQFAFIRSVDDPVKTSDTISYDSDSRQLKIGVSAIMHYTIGVRSIQPEGTIGTSNYLKWALPQYASEVLGNQDVPYYLYAKVSKSEQSGEFLLSETGIGMESVDGYYHLLVGLLNSEYDGIRGFVPMYGFTEVSPGQVATDVIRDSEGNLIIDLARAKITAKNGAKIEGDLTIGSGSSGLENLSEWQGKQEQIDGAQQTADRAVSSLADINSDTVLDLSEKESVRREWIAINGVASTTEGGMSGSYYRTKQHLAELGLIDSARYGVTYDGKSVTYGGSTVYSELPYSYLLDKCYLNLREYLNEVQINDMTSVYRNFDFERLSRLFTAYYDAEKMLNDAEKLSLDRKIDERSEELLGQLEDYQTAVTDDIAAIQRQVDGAIESYFHEYDPAESNYPASEWTTTEEKEKHLKDTFTNIQTGASWKWVKNGDVYYWDVITDTASSKALAIAGEAKDTADGKRRVFVAQPANAQAYDIGDLWVNATYGSIFVNELLRCKTSKAAGIAFNISHWEKASKYTDDTAANEAKASAAAALSSIQDVQDNLSTLSDTVSNLDTYIDGAFRDGVIDETEKQAILGYVNIVNESFADLESSYAGLENSDYLDASYREVLYLAFLNLTSAKDMLLGAIANTDSDNYGAFVDDAYSDYILHVTTFRQAYEAANTAIQNKLKGFSDEAQQSADAAAQSAAAALGIANEAGSLAEAAAEEAERAQNAVNSMNNDTVFSVIEKKTMRVEWYSISGVASTSSGATGDGSYSKAAGLAAEAGIDSSPLDDAYENLRTFLNSHKLYIDINMPGLDREALSDRFAAYYAAEIALLDEVSKIGIAAVQNMADIASSKADTAQNTADTASNKADSAKSAADEAKAKADAAAQAAENAKAAADDLAFLHQSFDALVDINGVLLADLVAVQDAETGLVQSGINGSDLGRSNEHGDLMIFAGAEGIDEENRTVENAKMKLYEDGYFETARMRATGDSQFGSWKIDADRCVIDELKSEGTTENGEYSSMLAAGGLASRYYNPESGAERMIEVLHMLMSCRSAWDTYSYINILSKRGDKLYNNNNVALRSATQDKDELIDFDPEYDGDLTTPSGNYDVAFETDDVALDVRLYDRDNRHYSVYAQRGMFAGLRPKTRFVSESTTLDQFDHTICCWKNGGYIELTMPSGPQNGQTYRIYKHSSNFALVLQHPEQILNNVAENSKSHTVSISGQTGLIIECVWSEEDNSWWINY